MAKSMTGYGRSEIATKNIYGYVEIRSKNHRYRDISIILPKKFSSFEIPLQNLMNTKIHRGKVDIVVRINSLVKPGYRLSLNRELLSEYKNIFAQISGELGVKGELDIVKVSQITDLIVTDEDEDVEKEYLTDITDAALKAYDSLESMRVFEGDKMIEELAKFMSSIDERLKKIEVQREIMVSEYYGKIRGKISALLNESDLNEQRLYQEVAYIIDKTDITEELARYRSHLSQFDKIIKEDGAIGKKLDFLFQEMNRETNTIGSKANDFNIVSHVIEVKNELERAREQAQNIE